MYNLVDVYQLFGEIYCFYLHDIKQHDLDYALKQYVKVFNSKWSTSVFLPNEFKDLQVTT
jgi:hypothetical protein